MTAPDKPLAAQQALDLLALLGDVIGSARRCGRAEVHGGAALLRWDNELEKNYQAFTHALRAALAAQTDEEAHQLEIRAAFDEGIEMGKALAAQPEPEPYRAVTDDQRRELRLAPTPMGLSIFGLTERDMTKLPEILSLGAGDETSIATKLMRAAAAEINRLRRPYEKWWTRLKQEMVDAVGSETPDKEWAKAVYVAMERVEQSTDLRAGPVGERREASDQHAEPTPQSSPAGRDAASYAGGVLVQGQPEAAGEPERTMAAHVLSSLSDTLHLVKQGPGGRNVWLLPYEAEAILAALAHQQPGATLGGELEALDEEVARQEAVLRHALRADTPWLSRATIESLLAFVVRTGYALDDRRAATLGAAQPEPVDEGRAGGPASDGGSWDGY